MLKIIFIFAIFISTLTAASVSATMENIRSFPLNVNNINLKAKINYSSENLDIFGVLDDDNGNASDHGSLGDLTALGLSVGYGYKEYMSLFYNLEFQNFDYAGESLQNNHHDLFVKLNIYNNPSSFLETFTTDIGIIHNGANDLMITGSDLGISKMSSMSDNSFYIRALTGTKIMSSILDFYLGLKYTKINTKIDSISYDRNEFSLNGGFQYTLELGNYLIETGYEYIKLFNRDIGADKNNNHIFNLILSYVINKQLLVSVGGKFFIHQYNGVIPYLYNEKIENSSSQKHGFAIVGFVYNFDI